MNSRSGQIMSKKLVTIRIDDSVRTAYQVMREHKIRHLPVVDQSGEVIGIMSDRDLKRAMVPLKNTQRKHAIIDGITGEAKIEMDDEVDFFPDQQAKDYMTWPARTVSEESSISEVTRVILQEKISALLVSDAHDQIKGILTTDDLLRHLLKLLDKSPNERNSSIKSFVDYYKWNQMNWL